MSLLNLPALQIRFAEKKLKNGDMVIIIIKIINRTVFKRVILMVG